jgi:hypothetical protein
LLYLTSDYREGSKSAKKGGSGEVFKESELANFGLKPN